MAYDNEPESKVTLQAPLVGMSLSIGGAVFQTHWPQDAAPQDQDALADSLWRQAARMKARADIAELEQELDQLHTKAQQHDKDAARLDVENDAQCDRIKAEIAMMESRLDTIMSDFEKAERVAGKQGAISLRGDAKNRHMAVKADLEQRKAELDRKQAERAVSLEQRRQWREGHEALVAMYESRRARALAVLEG